MNPLDIIVSKIGIALVAAPFLKLSLTTHKFKLFSHEKSSRIRPTNTSSFPNKKLY